MKDLSDVQKNFLANYKANENFFAEKINSNLLRGDESDPNIKILDQIINETAFKDEEVIYRATSNSTIDDFIKEGYYINPCFLSCTTTKLKLNRHFHNPDNQVILEIRCTEGTKMTRLVMGTEDEILLGRNNKFKIENKEVYTDTQKIQDVVGRLSPQVIRKLTYYKLITVEKSFFRKIFNFFKNLFS